MTHKLWKYLFLLALTLGLLLSLCACGGDTEPEESLPSDVIQTEAHNPDPGTEPDEPQTAPQLTRQCPDNILMPQTGDNYNSPVFGNEAITHEDITSVTFLDTLDGMPADAWDVSEAQNGTVMAWLENGTDLYIAGDGGVTASDCYQMFYRFYNATSINFNDCFYTDHTTNMTLMFSGCEELTELDLSFFNTRNAESLARMFDGSVNLTSVDLSSFDTSNVISLDSMFFLCERLTALDLSHFNTSNVVRFGGMFAACHSLTSLDLSNFDTSKAQDLSGMFYGCHSLSELDISSFNTSSAMEMTQMFMECKSLTSLDLRHFDTSSVTRFGGMFQGCENLEVLDVSSFRTPQGTHFATMFADCPKLTTLDLSGFDFSQATTAKEMFKYSFNLSDINCTITPPEGCNTTDMYLGSELG